MHPMANDGEVEFNQMLTSPSSKTSSHLDQQHVVVQQNSILISILTITECLNLSSLKWRSLVYNFINSFGEAMRSEPNEFELNYEKMKYYMDNKESISSL